MVAQKDRKKKKNGGKHIFPFLNAYSPKTQLIKVLNSIDSSRTYRRLLEIPKPGSSRELFLPENGFKKHLFFTKSIHILEAWKSMEDMKFRLFFKCPSTQ